MVLVLRAAECSSGMSIQSYLISASIVLGCLIGTTWPALVQALAASWQQ